MTEADIMNCYEDLQRLTGRMLTAARAGSWEDLAALESDCHRLVERLVAAPDTALGPSLQRRKIEMIHQVLADDAAIRRLVEPRLAQLELFMGAAPWRRRVGRAYADGQS